MNYLNLFVLFLATTFLFDCKTNADNQQNKNQPAESTSSALHDQLDEYFKALVSLKQFNGVALVEKDGEVIFRKAYNLNNDPKSTSFVTAEHQFDLRSISKLIAKYAVYKLEKEGKISPNDKVKKYLPDFPKGDIITIQQLMDHQSGLPRNFEDDEVRYFDMDPPEIIELIKKETLEFEPGTETRYSNLGYQILYFIIAKLHNKTFAQYVQDEIYDAFGMNSSGAHFYTNKNHLKNFAKYHTLEDKEIVKIDHFEVDTKKQARLFSTVDDLSKLLDAFEQNPYREKLASSTGIIAHSGGSEGIRTHIQTNISKGYAFIFSANYDAIPFSDIVKTLEQIIEEKPYVVPKELNRKSITLSEDQIQKYVGRYDFKDAGHLTIDIKIKDGQLAVYQHGEFSTILFSETETVFFGDPKSSESIEFKKDDKGNYYAIMDFKGAPWEGTKIK